MVLEGKTKHLELFGYGLFDTICYNSLPIQKLFTFHNVRIAIKSVVNKIKINANGTYF